MLFFSALSALSAVNRPLAANNDFWKYKHVTVVVQNSGAIRGQNALVLVEVINRLAAMKPAGVSFSLFAFDREFRQLDQGRFARSVAKLLDSGDAAALRESVGEMSFIGPSPVFDAVAEALAGTGEDAAVLLISNGIDNASDVSFDDLTRRAEKAGVPIIAFYFPTNPPMNGDSRLRKLAKSSGGRFIDVRVKDSWEQLVTALR